MLEKAFYVPQYVLLILVYMFPLPRNLASTIKSFSENVLYTLQNSASLLACCEIVAAKGRITDAVHLSIPLT